MLRALSSRKLALILLLSFIGFNVLSETLGKPIPISETFEDINSSKKSLLAGKRLLGEDLPSLRILQTARASKCVKECTPHCAECFSGSSNQCKTCKRGYKTNDNGQCQPCAVPNCSSCQEGIDKCSACGNGTYLRGKECLECPKNCEICSNASNCSDCKEGYVILRSQGAFVECVSRRRPDPEPVPIHNETEETNNGSDTNNTTDPTDVTDYIPEKNSSETPQPDKPDFRRRNLEEDSAEEDKLVTCKFYDWTKHFISICKECQPGFGGPVEQIDGETSYECNKKCKVANCGVCAPDINKCNACLPKYQFDSKGRCVTCAGDCEKCDTQGNCYECKEGFSVACPSGSFFTFEPPTACQACPEHCEDCSSADKCQRCEKKYKKDAKGLCQETESEYIVLYFALILLSAIILISMAIFLYSYANARKISF